jgi:hypothetical protein
VDSDGKTKRFRAEIVDLALGSYSPSFFLNSFRYGYLSRAILQALKQLHHPKLKQVCDITWNHLLFT